VGGAVTPLSPDLTDALLMSSVAVLGKSAYVLADFAFTGRRELGGEAFAWLAAMLGLTCATLLSAGDWRTGVLNGAVAVVLEVLWQRERTAA
jgi:hypothetical protein